MKLIKLVMLFFSISSVMVFAMDLSLIEEQAFKKLAEDYYRKRESTNLVIVDTENEIKSLSDRIFFFRDHLLEHNDFCENVDDLISNSKKELDELHFLLNDFTSKVNSDLELMIEKYSLKTIKNSDMPKLKKLSCDLSLFFTLLYEIKNTQQERHAVIVGKIKPEVQPLSNGN